MSGMKTLGLLSLAAVVTVGGYLALVRSPEVPTVESAEPVRQLSFEEFQDKVFWDVAKRSPQRLSSLRHFESQGITEHNRELDNLSIEFRKQSLAQTTMRLGKLKGWYPDEDLSEEQRFNKALMVHGMQEDVDNARFLYHDYPLTQLFGWHNGIVGFLSGTHTVTNSEDASHYVTRLYRVQQQFDQIMEQLRDRESRGIIPPTFILDKVLVQLDDFVTRDVRENALYLAFEGKLKAVNTISNPDKLHFLSQASEAIRTVLYPVWAELRAYVAALKAKSNNDAGVWKLPDGEAFYQAELRRFTTTDMTADEIHNIGLAEVARIQQQMLELFEAEGYDTSTPFAALINDFAAEERHYYPDTKEGRAQILADYTAMIDEISAGISNQFNMTPKAPVEVVRVPEFLEQGAPGGYYDSPALDGSRPGRFYANLYDIKATPKYGMRALTYHEAVPGHHYQIALQQEREDLPWFRKFLGYTAYVEGWALYAERVAMEMGFQKTNLDKIGALQSEMFRAVRLVVDTGIHAKRWSREEAITYMAENTGVAMSDVVTEIERYIVWPGQATSYMIGQLTLLRLRAEAQEALGVDFDIREFHDTVLKVGAVPLTILEDQVKAYVTKKQQS